MPRHRARLRPYPARADDARVSSSSPPRSLTRASSPSRSLLSLARAPPPRRAAGARPPAGAQDTSARLAALKDLPQLRDTAAPKREALFEQKLQLCSIIFDFDDPNADKRGKELKRQTLLELVDFVNTSAGQKIFNETLMPAIVLASSRSTVSGRGEGASSIAGGGARGSGSGCSAIAAPASDLAGRARPRARPFEGFACATRDSADDEAGGGGLSASSTWRPRPT